MKMRNQMRVFIVSLASAGLLSGCRSADMGDASNAPSSGTVKEPGNGMQMEMAIPSVSYNEVETSHYDVVKRSEAPTLDGVLDDPVWKDIGQISGSFHYPWEALEAPMTVYKAYHDGSNFYFSFHVTDDEVLSSEEWKSDESTVDLEDRVEMFFAGASINKPGAEGLIPYYAIEVDPQGRIHDYAVKYYRNFDSEWSLDSASYKATTTETGYDVEGSIPISTLESLGLINSMDIMRTGVFRAEFSEQAGTDPKMQWISWVDPKTSAPDFHVDSAFGEFRFLGI